MFAHVHFCNSNVWLIMWVCSMKVEAVLLAAFVLFLSPAMPNLDRNTDKNHTSSRYKEIILFWRLSIANQGKTNIDKNTCEPSNLRLFLLTKLRRLFSHLRPSPSTGIYYIYIYMFLQSENVCTCTCVVAYMHTCACTGMIFEPSFTQELHVVIICSAHTFSFTINFGCKEKHPV